MAPTTAAASQTTEFWVIIGIQYFKDAPHQPYYNMNSIPMLKTKKGEDRNLGISGGLKIHRNCVIS